MSTIPSGWGGPVQYAAQTASFSILFPTRPAYDMQAHVRISEVAAKLAGLPQNNIDTIKAHANDPDLQDNVLTKTYGHVYFPKLFFGGAPANVDKYMNKFQETKDYIWMAWAGHYLEDLGIPLHTDPTGGGNAHFEIEKYVDDNIEKYLTEATTVQISPVEMTPVNLAKQLATFSNQYYSRLITAWATKDYKTVDVIFVSCIRQTIAFVYGLYTYPKRNLAGAGLVVGALFLPALIPLFSYLAQAAAPILVEKAVEKVLPKPKKEEKKKEEETNGNNHNGHEVSLEECRTRSTKWIGERMPVYGSLDKTMDAFRRTFPKAPCLTDPSFMPMMELIYGSDGKKKREKVQKIYPTTKEGQPLLTNWLYNRPLEEFEKKEN